MRALILTGASLYVHFTKSLVLCVVCQHVVIRALGSVDCQPTWLLYHGRSCCFQWWEAETMSRPSQATNSTVTWPRHISRDRPSSDVTFSVISYCSQGLSLDGYI